MTQHEFVSEMKEIYELFEKPSNDVYNKRLLSKIQDLTVYEFRAIKSRVLDECEHFPRLSKWANLKNWILDKRIERPMPDEVFKNCEVCLSTGFIHVAIGASKTFVKCICEMSKRWPIDEMPTLERVQHKAKIIPWRLSDFKPSAERSFDNLAEGFREQVNIAQQFWAHNKGLIA